MKKEKVSIGLSNPKNPLNVGAVIRAAGCFSVDSVFYTGERYDRAVKLNTDTKHVRRSIPLMPVASLVDAVPDDMTIVCVEMVEGAMPLPEFRHPDRAFYIFGPEDGTLSQEVINSAGAVVYVPTIGCMNLAAVINVVLYDRMSKADLSMASNALIRKNRDTNNNVKINVAVE